MNLEQLYQLAKSCPDFDQFQDEFFGITEGKLTNESIKACEEKQCKCTTDETTGHTTVKCCNICGNPIEKWKLK